MRTFFIEGKELSSLIIGSSPFCGSLQFKEKAPVYFKKFFEQPKNITELLVHFSKKGYNCAHLIPFPPMIWAAKESYKRLGYSFPLIFTIMPGDMDMQWNLMKKLDTVVVSLHGDETDKLNKDTIKRFSESCRKNNVIPALSTHNGGITIPWVDEQGFDISAYLVPFNKTGAHVYPSLEETLKAIKQTDKTVIGMKVLSCGDLSPREAFPFSLPMVDALTVGMVTKGEIDEDCRIFEEYHHLLGQNRKKK
ncbi:MAG: hypothetical protein K8T10_06140 [Candidatus Eremiobacteraeota bacterium]|nr:hypothetical protein [Candidatus Eremiobacteraeota bacterium]